MITTTNAGKKFAGVRPTPLLKPVFAPFSFMPYNLPYPARCYWERLREQLGNMMETHILGTSQGTTWEHDGNTYIGNVSGNNLGT
jgi:hypothetical protein